MAPNRGGNRRFLKLGSVAAGVLIIGLLVTGVAVLSQRSTDPVTAGDTKLEKTEPKTKVAGKWPKAKKKPKETFEVADAAGSSIGLYSKPNKVYEPKPSLDNPTHEGLAVVFLVLEDKGDWLKVRVSSRPNGLVAWVKKSEVSLRSVDTKVTVNLADRTLKVTSPDGELLETVVAIGTEATPTPIGEMFVDGIVPLPEGNRAYGTGQVSVAGFSEVLQSFGGGNGQIAIHGTYNTGVLGQEVSNGCIRVDNASIEKLMLLVSRGTPVEIVAGEEKPSAT